MRWEIISHQKQASRLSTFPPCPADLSGNYSSYYTLTVHLIEVWVVLHVCRVWSHSFRGGPWWCQSKSVLSKYIFGLVIFCGEIYVSEWVSMCLSITVQNQCITKTSFKSSDFNGLLPIRSLCKYFLMNLFEKIWFKKCKCHVIKIFLYLFACLFQRLAWIILRHY